VLPPPTAHNTTQVFAPFVSAGVLEFVYGSADVGATCTRHARVQCIHLTGSDTTYNNIVFGTPSVQVCMGWA
jgi:acyl-CoA reductase-like NAD-dependent aldehyde dehydrogenase